MNSNLVNKLAVVISWPREIDMLLPLIHHIPKTKFLIIINDFKSFETGRTESSKLILKYIKDKRLPYELFSNILKKKKFKILLSTGEICGKKITVYSFFRFFYAISLGFLIDKIKLSVLFNKIFNNSLTAEGLNCRIGLPWYPEKQIGQIVVKFPDGADIKKKNYPYNFLKDVFDIFLTYTDSEIEMIKKKFKSKICKKIDYLRYKKLSSKEDAFKSFKKNQLFKKEKKNLYWIPTHIDSYGEKNLNIQIWSDKISKLQKNFNLIVKPHPKTLLTDISIIKFLEKKNFIVDRDHNRKIGNLIKNSDIVLCDYGGPVFSTLYLNKPLVLLNLPKNSKYNVELKKIDALDIKIRKQIISLDYYCSEKKLLNSIKKSFTSEYKKKIKVIKDEHFGNTKPYSAKKLSNFLLKLLN